jgi:hypothetical protein
VQFQRPNRCGCEIHLEDEDDYCDYWIKQIIIRMESGYISTVDAYKNVFNQ